MVSIRRDERGQVYQKGMRWTLFLAPRVLHCVAVAACVAAVVWTVAAFPPGEACPIRYQAAG